MNRGTLARFSMYIASLPAEDILDKQVALDMAVERVPNKQLTSSELVT